MSRYQDLLAIRRSVGVVARAAWVEHENYWGHRWRASSSLLDFPVNVSKALLERGNSPTQTEQLLNQHNFDEFEHGSTGTFADTVEISHSAGHGMESTPQTSGHITENEKVASYSTSSSITHVSHDETVLAKNLDDTPIPKGEEVVNTAAENDEDFGGINIQENKLAPEARQRRVPSTRVERLVGFGGLAVGVALGAASERLKRTVGLSEGTGSALASTGNLERVVATLCRMRGAALKLGQMLSIQDNALIPRELQHVFDRVRHSADFMPHRQMQKVLSKELGDDWREKLKYFDETPLAAASIGQVHRGVTHSGQAVAIKVQYPGVGESIASDIANLMTLLKMSRLLPEGLYMENTMKVAQLELGWECDYQREAKCMEVYRRLLGDTWGLSVPGVVPELSTRSVLTTHLVPGTHLDQLFTAPQPVRNAVSTRLMMLSLREIFEFRFMQTDPNWSNFLYHHPTDTIHLLDFGASRSFPKHFTDHYLRTIQAAVEGRRHDVIEHSIALGFLTGNESEVMANAHADSVMILAEPFASSKPTDFTQQDITARIHKNIPVMLRHRLKPPPNESYSLHRKLAGAFLTCARMGATVDCKPMFERVLSRYDWDSPDSH
eukprot:Colp12_sorted_trinity150504_noHs@8846